MKTPFCAVADSQRIELRRIEILENELRLVYENETELDLEFADQGQLDRFVSHLVLTLVSRENAEEFKWN